MSLSQLFTITVETERECTQEEVLVGVKVELMTETSVIHSPIHKGLHKSSFLVFSHFNSFDLPPAR